MLLEDVRRRHENACSRNIKDREGRSYCGWVSWWCLVTVGQALRAFNSSTTYDFV